MRTKAHYVTLMPCGAGTSYANGTERRQAADIALQKLPATRLS